MRRIEGINSNWRPVATTVLLLQLSACAHQPVSTDAKVGPETTTEVSQCRDLLATNWVTDDELDASNISLFNWNVHKTRERGWRDDFDALAGTADLVLFQEASIREETIAEIDSSRHWSFAPGYTKLGEVTGVMTLSSIKPLAQCSFTHAEPWLRTPKATSVTRYALSDTQETLVVVNVHAVNFSFAGVFLEVEGSDELVQAVLDAIYERASVHQKRIRFRREGGERILSVTTSFLEPADGAIQRVC